MAFSSGGGGNDRPIAAINVVPMVDVLLVLLIIFMVTAQLLTNTVQIELPKADLLEIPDAPSQILTVSVTDSNLIYLGDQEVTLDLLETTLLVEAQKTPQPVLQIRGDTTTRYGTIAGVVNIAQAAGMRKVGYIATIE